LEFRRVLFRSVTCLPAAAEPTRICWPFHSSAEVIGSEHIVEYPPAASIGMRGTRSLSSNSARTSGVSQAVWTPAAFAARSLATGDEGNVDIAVPRASKAGYSAGV